jgi:glyoxylase-like metal-dependent hydrolase (beta-lactamase superfamily II)
MYTAKIHRYEAKTTNFFVNAFLIETQNGVVAVDATLAISDAKAIRNRIDNEIKKPLLAVLVTHGHPDHYTGLVELTKGLNVPIYATQGTIDFAKQEDERKATTAVAMFGSEYPAKRIFPNKIVRHGDILDIDGSHFELRDYGPGESDDDTLWITETDGVKNVFLGDILHNQMHCFFRDIHAVEWLKSLDRLIQEFDHTAIFHTSHGGPCGIEMAHFHKGYILAFIDLLKSMLKGRDSLEEHEKENLVKKMQNYIPNENLLFLMTFELDETIKLFKEKGLV